MLTELDVESRKRKTLRKWLGLRLKTVKIIMIWKAGEKGMGKGSGRAEDRKQTQQQFILDRLESKMLRYCLADCEPGVQGKGRA